MSGHFTTIVVVDFEYEIDDMICPTCSAWWRTCWIRIFSTCAPFACGAANLAPTPPFDIGPDTLFVAYSAWAEMTCFMTLGWQFPVHIFDLHTAYLAASNVLLPYDPDEVRKKPRKRLSDACRAYDIDGWERIDKETIASDIGEGRWRDYGQEASSTIARKTCACRRSCCCAQLAAARICRPPMSSSVLHWSNYSAKAVAHIQARGMPIDMPLWNLVQENKAAVIGELLRQFDPSHGSDNPIYTPEGEWSYARFESWLARAGVAAWPRLESGQLDVDGDAFRLMYHVPGIEGLHALRDSLGVIVRAKLPIGATAAIAQAYFRSAPPPAATRIPKACTTRTPACAHSWSFRRTRSASIWTGARRKSESPRHSPATKG